MSNAATYNRDLDAWLHLTEENLTKLARQSIQELATRVHRETPVQTGNLRAHWQSAINVLPPRRPGEDDVGQDAAADPNGTKSLDRIVMRLQGMKAGDVFYVYNSAAYAMRIEFGFVGADKLGRVYNQRGQFFVRGQIAKWDRIVAETAVDLGFTAR